MFRRSSIAPTLASCGLLAAVLTFNDELGDGVPLEQALADALHALHIASSRSVAR